MKIEVQISENYMSTHILVRVDKGESPSDLTKEKLYTVLHNKGINTGINSNSIDRILSNNIYNKPIQIACGIPPESGENARVEILKKPKREKDVTPPKTADGGIDYYSPRDGFLVYAKKGDVMAGK